MVSCEWIERPARWRIWVIAIILTLSVAPALPLLSTLFFESSTENLLSAGFVEAVLNSLTVAFAVFISSITLGAPAGVLSAYYDFPFRRPLIALVALPLIIPSFLWAIGISQLSIFLGNSSESFLTGVSGTILTLDAIGVPLVFYISFIAARKLSKSQLEAVRLSGGESYVIRYALQAVMPITLLAGLLAGILTLSNPGPGQILGFSGIPYEILLSFSAFYDFSLATKQCLFQTFIILLISIPTAIFLAPKIATELFGKTIGSPPLTKGSYWGWLALSLLALSFIIFSILPMIGFVRPLFIEFPFSRAFQEISRTGFNTFFYSGLAGLISTFLGFTLAFIIGRGPNIRRVSLIGLFIILSLPPSLNTLGFIKLGTSSPAWLDPLVRSRLTVSIALAFRFLPIATILAMRSFGMTAPSQSYAASVHGISFLLYFRRVLVPILFSTMMISFLIVFLLSTAEIGTVLLLRPPGADSLPVQIFTVMANAPETLVASLCFLYVVGAGILLIIGWGLTGIRGIK